MKKTLVPLFIFLVFSFFTPLFAQNDTINEKESLDRYYALDTFGESVFLSEEATLKAYIFYVGKMDNDQYRYFFYLLKQNAPFKIKETWDKQFVQIETTEQDFKLIKPKLIAAKKEMETLWQTSANPLLELERRMR